MFLALFAYSFLLRHELGYKERWGSALNVLKENRARENKTDVKEDL